MAALFRIYVLTNSFVYGFSDHTKTIHRDFCPACKSQLENLLGQLVDMLNFESINKLFEATFYIKFSLSVYASPHGTNAENHTNF